MRKQLLPHIVCRVFLQLQAEMIVLPILSKRTQLKRIADTNEEH